jgi:hypothetical protein
MYLACFRAGAYSSELLDSRIEVVDQDVLRFFQASF